MTDYSTYAAHLFVTAQALGITPSEPTNPPGINTGEPGFKVVAKDVTAINTVNDVTYPYYRLSGFQLNNEQTFSNGQWWDLYGYTGTATDPTTDTNPAHWVLVSERSMTPKPDLVAHHGMTDDYIIFNMNVGGGSHLILSLTDKFTSTPTHWEKAPGTGTINFAGNSGKILCFLKGTLIATPEGEKAIEALEIGDEILSLNGEAVKVVWIGRKEIARIALRAQDLPVCITKNAFAPAIPHSDLFVTADHGMVLEGCVVNAGALVNGTTVRIAGFEEVPSVVTYYHIETTNHEVIIANGAPSETYINYVSRTMFDNYSEYLELTGAERIIAELQMTRVSSSRQLPEGLKERFGMNAELEEMVELSLKASA